MTLDRGCKVDDRIAVERLTKQHVCAHDARNGARRGRAKAAGLRDSAVLNDGQTGKRLAALVVDALCTLIDQIALVLRDVRIAARTSPRPFSFSAAAFISAVDSLRV